MKYYVISTGQEDNYAHIVQLTEEEATIVRYALDWRNSVERAGNCWGEGYGISEPFDTIEDAREEMNELV